MQAYHEIRNEINHSSIIIRVRHHVCTQYFEVPVSMLTVSQQSNWYLKKRFNKDFSRPCRPIVLLFTVHNTEYVRVRNMQQLSRVLLEFSYPFGQNPVTANRTSDPTTNLETSGWRKQFVSRKKNRRRTFLSIWILIGAKRSGAPPDNSSSITLTSSFKSSFRRTRSS